MRATRQNTGSFTGINLVGDREVSRVHRASGWLPSSTFPQYNGVIMAWRVNRSRGSGESVRVVPEPFADLSPSNPRSARSGRLQDRLPKSDTVAPSIRQYGLVQDNMIASRGADLRVWVELRGFEPLTPSCEGDSTRAYDGLCVARYAIYLR